MAARSKKKITVEQIKALGEQCRTYSPNWFADIYPVMLAKADLAKYPNLKEDKVRGLLYYTTSDEYIKGLFFDAGTAYCQNQKKVIIQKLKEEIAAKQKMIKDLSKSSPASGAKPFK